MKDQMTVEEFKRLLSSGNIKKGRLVVDKEPEPYELPKGTLIDASQYIFIPGRVYSSKNSTQIRVRGLKHGERSKFKLFSKGVWRPIVPFVAKSDNAARYKKEKVGLFRANKQRFDQMKGNNAYPLYIEFVFAWPDRGRWDWSNILQIVQDTMVDAGLIPDDSVRYMFPVMPPKPVLPYFIDRKNPGVYFRVV